MHENCVVCFYKVLWEKIRFPHCPSFKSIAWSPPTVYYYWKLKAVPVSEPLQETWIYLLVACRIFLFLLMKSAWECVCSPTAHWMGPFNSFGNSWALVLGAFIKLFLGWFPHLPFLFSLPETCIIDILCIPHMILTLPCFFISLLLLFCFLFVWGEIFLVVSSNSFLSKIFHLFEILFKQVFLILLSQREIYHLLIHSSNSHNS